MEADAWITLVKERLSKEGFRISSGADHGVADVPVLAIREKFEITKFGMETISVFIHELQSADAKSVETFSSQSATRANKLKSTPLPNGFFSMTTCFPVSYSRTALIPEMKSFLDQYSPKHWAATEFPVVVDLANEEVLYKESTPTWGSAYYKHFREFAHRILAPKA